MFSFHKPKVYRSSTGCCICKAKSSSSRFTDSKKYEDDFMLCFQLDERRSGEICNACVLLVKRFKKLPPGNDRNWRHVVDARAGPGIKSLTKFKAKNKRKVKDISDKLAKKKHVYVKTETDREQSPSMSDDLIEDYTLADSKASSRSESISDDDDDIGSNDKQLDLVQDQDMNEDNDFLDLSYYKREIICCGSIFRGANGEIIMYPSSLKPCVNLARRQLLSSLTVASPTHSSASTSPIHSVELPSSSSETSSKQTKTDSDSSSDSGYDESSNQGESKIAKNVQVQADVKMIEETVRPIELDQLSSCKTLQSVTVTNQSLQSVSN
ncbi:PREDICTED: protein FAM60A [Acromyrmex echinatior]|uniref:Protein FAM60A n=1 Tax=Acromyrmex echinatior TaxID=103372 RepID=F4X4N2_ACREC|nr:PREDICTED: protein FAM60A [Acromyrmex echinatior]XP_011065490.1 PREDICTED: protein FAM60A [Acromyrmex echinatior]XP_011065491.1 PREDICTED: protein FAM60A [Acromyrmex echinatior]EGI58586.1 Protein FAM60A [Acromyrmex echinatior]